MAIEPTGPFDKANLTIFFPCHFRLQVPAPDSSEFIFLRLRTAFTLFGPRLNFFDTASPREAI